MTATMTPPPLPSLFHLSWPIFVDLGMHFATIMINTAMVGMISVAAVAELTVGNQVFDLGFVLFNFINIGVAVVTAQALGNGNLRMVRRVIHMGLGLNIVWGAAVCLAVFSCSGLIVEAMHVPPEIAGSSVNYMRIISLCFLPEAACLCCAQILRGYGRTRDSMYISMLMNLITMCLNAVFLFGLLGAPRMGVEGVALSTVIGRLACVGIIFKLMLARTRVRIVPRFLFSIKWRILRQILSVGLPGAGENLSWHLQFMVMTAVVSSLGALALATHGIYFQMEMLMTIWSISIGTGTEILVAHYAGAMRLKLAYRQLLRSVRIGFIITLAIAVTVPLFTGRLFFSCFTDSPEVIALASHIFLLTVVMEPGNVLNIIIINSLRAIGDTKFPVIMAVLSMWGVSVPLGSFLALHCGLGLLGVWIGFCADMWTRGLAMLIRWKTKAWVRHAVAYYRLNFERA